MKDTHGYAYKTYDSQETRNQKDRQQEGGSTGGDRVW